MKHRVKKGRKLGRDPSHRRSLLRNLLTSLIENQKLETTLAKGKEAKREFDLLVNLAKRAESQKNFSLKRKIFSFLSTKKAAQKLFGVLLPSFKSRSSGYLTLERLGKLRNDGGEVVLLEFVDKVVYDKEPERKAESRSARPRLQGDKAVDRVRRQQGTSGKAGGEDR